MYLRSLRIKGFKSFPRQTELVFEPGVAVVIGPNGSGKSNIVDAVMWALGEQSPTSIRGTSMQDVIFAGSDGRRASASAEVELTFDNSDGSLSLPAAEVSVGRRVVRGGETTYFINKATCRLADVLEIVAEMGLGRELHSIIGQGKVESLLSARPSDRRALVEEAAGLGVFKRRRERSDLKLREVRRNLERARDLEREAAAQLAPLRRQANAAELRRTVEGETAELRGRLLSGELDALDGKLAAQREALAAVAEERVAIDEGLAAAEDRRVAEEEAFARELRERERGAARALRGRYLGDRLESCARLAAQRARLLGEIEAAAQRERDGLAAEVELPAGGGEADAGRQLDLYEEAARAAEAAHEEAAAALGQGRAEVDALRAEAARAHLDGESLAARQARLAERRVALAAGLAQTAHQAGAANAALAEVRTAAAAAEADGGRAQQTADDAAAALAAADDECRAAEAELATCEAALRRTAGERTAAEAEVEHAGAALRELREADDDVLEVVRGSAAGTAAVALAGAFTCESGYERALGAALVRYGGALAVAGASDAWTLLGALREAGVRVARLLVGRPQRPIVAGYPGAVPLLDKVTVDDDDLEVWLTDVVIVDDLQAVPASFDGLAVTRDGAYYRPSSGELGLASGAPAALLAERRAGLEGLGEKVDALRAREVREVAAAARARASAEALARARAAAAQTVAETARTAAEARRRSEGLADDARHLGERQEQQAAAADDGEAGLTAMDDQLRAFEERAVELSAAVAAVAPALAAAEERLAALGERHDEALAAVTRTRIELEERRAVAARADEELRRARRRTETAALRLTEVEARLAGLPAAQAACRQLAAGLEPLCVRLATTVERLAAEAAGVDERVADRSLARRLADDEIELRRAADDLAERRAAVQVEVARLEERRADVAARFEAVAAQLETNVFAAPENEAEAAALSSRIERLERKGESIGPVNPLAEAECGRLQEHVDFLREQTSDLKKSVAELETLIGELTQRIEGDFDATFATVQENFARMAAVLFPGGSGRLQLVSGEEEGEPDGVGIEVKPARKLGKQLALLSGGERSLVALAFLLALLLSRPCPFYILDEVEAALDDINIGRFVSLVRDHRARTQFIIITHQKRTMEAADVLYGVTMGPDGTSQVVSARLAEEEIERQKDRG